MKLLFAASEAYPLVKTGGLADVAGSLPEVLRQQGVDVRLLLPAYGDLLESLSSPPELVTELVLAGEPVRILETHLPGTMLVTWLVDHPLFSQREGNPYHDQLGNPWVDNAQRFMLLSRAAAHISTGDSTLRWRPDVLHCNDWHTGPAIALVHLQDQRPLTVFYHSQSGTYGAVRPRHILPTAATGTLVAGRRPGVLRSMQFYQGRIGLRRLHHHGKSRLCPGNLRITRRHGVGGIAVAAP